MLDGSPSVNVGITAVTVAQNLREDGSLSPKYTRRKKSSAIFCSQYGFEEWYDQLGGDDSPLADAIIDRIAHDSYRINITNIDAEHDISIRDVYGLDKMLRE